MTEFYAFALKMADDHWFLTMIALFALGRFGNILSFRRNTEVKVELAKPDNDD